MSGGFLRAQLRRATPGLVLRWAHRLVIDAAHRSVVLLKVLRPEGLFQPYAATGPDRYPDLFALAAKEIGDGVGVRLLSFGCSTGEELFSLRQYFPHAGIRGLDINGHSVAMARRAIRRARDRRISVAAASDAMREPTAGYDAIFCMAVFRHGDLAQAGVERCDHLVSFECFDDAMAGLARCLKPGGLLFIRHSNFRFCDTRSFSDFEVVWREEALALSKEGKVFGRDNRLMPGEAYKDVVFRKHA